MNGRSKPMCSEKNLSQFYVVRHKSHTDFPVSKAVKGGSPQWCTSSWVMAILSWQHCIVVVINIAYSIYVTSPCRVFVSYKSMFLCLHTTAYSKGDISHTQKVYVQCRTGFPHWWLSGCLKVHPWICVCVCVCAVGSPGWQPLTQREDSDQLLNEPSMTA